MRRARYTFGVGLSLYLTPDRIQADVQVSLMEEDSGTELMDGMTSTVKSQNQPGSP